MKFDLSQDIDIKNIDSRLQYLKKKGAKVELIEKRLNRSLDQNKYLHICAAFIAQETGYTLEEAKHILKMDFGDFLKYQKDGNTFYRSTASLSQNECSKFIDWIRAMASRELGVYIPSSEEYLNESWEIEKQLQHVI